MYFALLITAEKFNEVSRENSVVKCLVAIGIMTAVFGSANSQDDVAESKNTPSALKYVVDESLPFKRSFRKLSNETPPGYDSAGLLGFVNNKNEGSKQQDRIVLAYTVFGATNSRSVAFAVDLEQDNLLWVDLNRDRKFTDSECISKGVDDYWIVELDSEYLVGDGKYEHVASQVVCKLSSVGSAVLVATDGCFKGHANLDGNKMQVIRSDDNSNGRWSDKQDRFMLDANGDGRFSLLSERFGFSPICKIGGEFFRVAGDERGSEFSVERSIGMGTIKPQIYLADAGARIVEFSATLVSESGVHVYLQNKIDAVSVPVGVYHVNKLFIELNSDDGIQTMNFARLPGSEKGSIEVAADQHIDLDPIVGLEISGSIATLDDKGHVNLVINPLVSTNTGCYLIDSRLDSRSGEFNSARAVSFHNNKPISVHQSGFL